MCTLQWIQCTCLDVPTIIGLELPLCAKQTDSSSYFSTRNRQRKLGTKLQWSPNFFCVDLEPPSPTLKHTHANKRSQQNHTGEPSFWTDAVVRSKGQKKKSLQVVKECLDLSWSLQPDQVRPHASPSCTACPKCSSVHARLCERYTI